MKANFSENNILTYHTNIYMNNKLGQEVQLYLETGGHIEGSGYGKRKCLPGLLLTSPNSDQHQIFPCTVFTPEVMRIKDIITQAKIFLVFNNFSTVLF